MASTSLFPLPGAPNVLPEPLDAASSIVPLASLRFPDDELELVEDAASEPPRERDGVIRLAPDQEARLLKQLRAHYEEALQGRDELIQRRETRYRRYLCDTTLRQGRQAWDESGQLFLPMTRTTLETLKDELTQALGGVDAISAMGVGNEDAPGAELHTEFLRYALREINPEHWEELLDAAEHDALQDAIAYWKVYPYEHPYVNEETEGQVLKTIVRLDVVDEGTLLIPPNATKLQWPECGYLGEQLWPSVDEFPSMEARGFTVPDVATLSTMLGQGQWSEDERKLLEFTRQGMQPDEASSEYDPHIEMVESYELFALKEGEPRSFLVIHWFPHLHTTTAAGAMGQLARVMRLEEALRQRIFPRPMWPYFPMTTWQQPRQLRGLSLVDRLESAQDLLNRLAEQMVEHGEVSILPYIFANVALAGDLPNLRRIKPGEVVPLDNMGSVQFSPQMSHSNHYIQQMQVARTWGEEDSGVTAFIQGRSQDQPNAPRTLGQVSLMLQQSQKGFKKQTQHQARQLSQVLKMYLGLWAGHVQPTLTIPIPDLEGLEQRLFEGQPVTKRRQQAIGPQDLGGAFDIHLKINPEAHLEQQKMLLLAEKLDGILGASWPLGQRELWKEVWTALGLQEFERFYPESVAAMRTMLLMLQQQMQLAQLEAQLGQTGQQPGGGPFAALFEEAALPVPEAPVGPAPPQPGSPPAPGAGGPGSGVGGLAGRPDPPALQGLIAQLTQGAQASPGLGG